MTITVSCPSCETSFPVDPAKVPPEGVRAQCSVCPEIFDVDYPNGATPAAAEAIETFDAPDPMESGTVDLPLVEMSFEETPEAAGDEAADSGVILTEDEMSGEVEIDIGPIDLPEPEAEPVEVAEEVAEVTEAVAEVADVAAPVDDADSPGPIRFGRRSPEDKAKSLARSLVSDLIAYNPEKHKEALSANNLVEVFGEEIEKSLKEYQEQVEPDVMAKGSFFNDALNAILAEGQSVFTLDD